MAMKVGWLQDRPCYTGGAELSGDALFDAAPAWAEVVYCPADKRPPFDIEAWVVINCVQYDARWIEPLSTGPIIKSVRDNWPHGNAHLRRWILDNAALVTFSSRLHRDNFPFDVPALVELVPAPVGVEPFRQAAQESADRQGNVWLGRLYDGKGIGRAMDWAVRAGQLDFYGEGPLSTQVHQPARYVGRLDYPNVPTALARYERFVFLPDQIEPFGRTVIEAFYAGCDLEIDESHIGAWEWMKYEPEALRNPTGLFWSIAESCLSGEASG